MKKMFKSDKESMENFLSILKNDDVITSYKVIDEKNFTVTIKNNISYVEVSLAKEPIDYVAEKFTELSGNTSMIDDYIINSCIALSREGVMDKQTALKMIHNRLKEIL